MAPKPSCLPTTKPAPRLASELMGDEALSTVEGIACNVQSSMHLKWPRGCRDAVTDRNVVVEAHLLSGIDPSRRPSPWSSPTIGQSPPLSRPRGGVYNRLVQPRAPPS